MNNPPDISQDPSEHEEYAHNVQKHVRGYLMVGATLLAFTAITVALSYVNFGAPKANIAVAMLVATFKAGLVAAIFMHLAAEKRLIYRILIFTGFFVLGFFWRGTTTRLFVKCRLKASILFSLSSRRCSRSGSEHGASGSISWKARRFIWPAQFARLLLRSRSSFTAFGFIAK